jgi:trehalose 6-phosphate phosphatase
VSARSEEALADALRPLTAAPERAAVLCDIDGTLAPIVQRAEDARLRKDVQGLLATLGRRYSVVACISGRSAAEARRLVGVGAVTYAGSHGAELLEPGASRPTVVPAFESWRKRVREFAGERDTNELRGLRVRMEDKGPIVAFHWRGVPDEDAARSHVDKIAGQAEEAGLAVHWARKVLEIRPPVHVDKGQAVHSLLARAEPQAALFGGDDATDLDAFAALESLVEDGKLDTAVRVGVRSDEGPAAIVERADLVVDGVDGFARVLAVLAEA